MRATCLAFALLLGIGIAVPLAQTRITTLHHLQTADFLYNKQYQIKLNSNLFDGYNSDDSVGHGYKIRAIGEAYVGITDRVVLGFQAGWEPSLSIKAKLLSEKGEYIPTLALAAHGVLASQEASFYRVLNDDTARGLRNAVSLVAAKSFNPISTRFQVGIQSLPLWTTENYTPFVGVEHYFGAGWYLSAEGFQRFEAFHANLGVSKRFDDRFLISLGLTEVKEFLFNENDEFGFFASGHVPGHAGYNTPGYYVTLCWNGNLGASTEGITSLEDEIRLANTRLDKLDQELTRIREALQSESARSMTLEKQVKETNALEKGKIKSRGGKSVAWFTVVNLLKEMMQILSSEMPYEPKDVLEIRKKITGLGLDGLPALKASALDRTADPRLRAAAAGILGEIDKAKDPETEELLIVLLAEPVLELRIEALMALGKLGMTGASQEIELLTNDPDETVAATAKSVLKQLKRKPASQPSAAPAVPQQ